MSKIEVNNIYRHHKGTLYVVTNLGVNANNWHNGKPVIGYKALVGDGNVYFRNQDEFEEEVFIDRGLKSPRFKLLPHLSRFSRRFQVLPEQLFPVFSSEEIKLYFAAYEELKGYPAGKFDATVAEILETVKEHDRTETLSLLGGWHWPMVIINVEENFQILSHKAFNAAKSIFDDPVLRIQNETRLLNLQGQINV